MELKATRQWKKTHSPGTTCGSFSFGGASVDQTRPLNHVSRVSEHTDARAGSIECQGSMVQALVSTLPARGSYGCRRCKRSCVDIQTAATISSVILKLLGFARMLLRTANAHSHFAADCKGSCGALACHGVFFERPCSVGHLCDYWGCSGDAVKCGLLHRKDSPRCHWCTLPAPSVSSLSLQAVVSEGSTMLPQESEIGLLHAESRSLQDGLRDAVHSPDCPAGYYDVTKGKAYWWQCGFGCPGGSYTD
eukprot:2718454-Amphidinium_carterae.1